MASFTILVNLFSMTISLWLSLYLITRSSHSQISWLAGFSCGAGASLFLRNLLAIELQMNGLTPWPRLMGLIGLMTWLHLTHLFLMQSANHTKLSLFQRMSSVGVYLSYGLGCAAIVYDTTFLFRWYKTSDSLAQPDLYHLGRYGPLHPLIILYFVGVGLHSLLNLWQAYRQTNDRTPKKTFTTLFIALFSALLGGVYLGIGYRYSALDLPAFPGDLFIGAGIVGVGYAVAHYHALIEGRTIERDLLYNVLGISLTVLCYGVLIWILEVWIYGEANIIFLVMIIVCAIVTHSLFDGVRTALDQIFYRRQFQQLRSHLRNLAREVGTQQTLTEQLESILYGIQRALHVQESLIVLRRDDCFVVAAAQNITMKISSFPSMVLLTPTITAIPQLIVEELPNMALLAPLHNGNGQIGALILGTKTSNTPYTEEDLEILDMLTAQITTVVHHLYQQEETMRRIDTMLAAFRIQEEALHKQIQHLQGTLTNYEKTTVTVNGISDKQLVEAVTECLRYLNNIAKLGHHSLAQLAVVTTRLQDQDASQGFSIARGHALRTVLLEALYRLQPEGNEPKGNLYSHEVWHLFVILRDLYELGEKVNEIRWKFPYADKTFYRRRTEAVEAVAKILYQMEQDTLINLPT